MDTGSKAGVNLTGTIMDRGGTGTVIIHGVVDGGHHLVVDVGVLTVVVLVMDHGVLMGVGDLMEVEIMVEVEVVKIMVQGVPMVVEMDIMGVEENLIGMGEDTTGLVEDPMGVEVGVVGGMVEEVHHQVGKIQEEVGIGGGHMGDGMETRIAAFMAMALHRLLVTEKVSSQICFLFRNQYFITFL
jgi:hypothetical protein